MKPLFGKDKRNEHDFWMSYTDLMSAFLIVFMIGCIFAYRQYNNERKAYERVCQKLNVANPDSLRLLIMEYTEVIDSIKSSNLTNEIERYRNVFKTDNPHIVVKFDSIRGSIVLKHRDINEDLFKPGKWELKEPLKPYIEEIYVALVDTTMAIAKEHENLEIRIEGHTDPTWDQERGGNFSFLKNLELSSNRAYAVYEYILNGDKLTPEQRKFLMEHMVSVGYSFSERVEQNDIDVEANDPSSRRIEFRIISKTR